MDGTSIKFRKLQGMFFERKSDYNHGLILAIQVNKNQMGTGFDLPKQDWIPHIFYLIMCGTGTEITSIYFLEPELGVLHKSYELPDNDKNGAW